MIGDLTADDLGIDGEPPAARDIIHLGTQDDIGADESSVYSTNVEGAARMIELATRLCAASRLVSRSRSRSRSSRRLRRGRFRSRATLFLALSTHHLRRREARTREFRSALAGVPALGRRRRFPHRQIDKIDGQYHFFAAISRLTQLPSPMPVAFPNIGSTNIVPVGYVADTLVALACADGRSGQTFHLVNPEPQPVHDIYAARRRRPERRASWSRYRASVCDIIDNEAVTVLV
ncbi:hypothetical protein A0W34_32120 (plasmid) [Rhodococcus sp. BH4]|nr:hypothetical protein [Rhodococcus sp. BH4]ARE38120.1 hypothetical protein A0W34_32120 [Rhodococcus sp. BH4]